MCRTIHKIALITNLTQNKVSKFSDSTYVTVDSIAYDQTNQVLGLKVNGADTVIPFSKGGKKRFTLAGYQSQGIMILGTNEWKKITCISVATSTWLRIDKDGAFLQYLPVGESFTFEDGHSWRIWTNAQFASGQTIVFDLE